VLDVLELRELAFDVRSPVPLELLLGLLGELAEIQKEEHRWMEPFR